MNDNQTFSTWDAEIHQAPDQRKRIASAKSSKTTPSSVDKERMSAVFPGSGKKPYFTTLDSCSCGDFLRRQLPCKHIYRLAIELGVLNEAAEQGVNKNTLDAMQFSLKEAVGELENLSEESQLTVKSFLYLDATQHDKFPILAESVGDDLMGCKLLELTDSPITALQMFKRRDLIAALDKNQVTGFKRNMSTAALSQWCLDNVENVMGMIPKTYVFRFSDYFRKARRKTYSYLLRKFDWDEYLDEDMNTVEYPHGAQFGSSPDICYFPDDEITQLLTLYGHNRCLNGYHAVPETNS